MLKINNYCFLCSQSVAYYQYGVCFECQQQLSISWCDEQFYEQFCERCGLPITAHLCETEDEPCWQKIIFVTDYKRPLNLLVQRLKFSRHDYLAKPLARLILLRWLIAFNRGIVNKPDRIISVPLHPIRYWWRSFNQTEQLANPLAHWLTCKYSKDTLLRHRNTPYQSHLNASQRKKNLQSAFALTHDITSEHIALLDDVITTGSTMNTITQLLLDNGAASVQVWCVCRTL